MEKIDTEEVTKEKSFDEKSLNEVREENFRKPIKLYDSLNISVKSLNIFLGILFAVIMIALIFGAK